MLSKNRIFAAMFVFTLVGFSANGLQAEDVGKVGQDVANKMQEVGHGLVETIRSAIQGDSVALKTLTDDYLIPAGMVIILMIVGFMIASFVGRFLGTMVSTKVDKTLGKFSSKMVRNVIMIIVALGVLSHFNIDVTSFAAILAAAGFAVGMALQGTLGNFAAGIMLLMFRPFKVDDYVKLGDYEGTVEEIELFTTQLNTVDNRRLIIPNGKIYGETMVHFTKNDCRRVDVNVGADYSADLNYTRQILEQAISEIEGADSSREIQVYLCDLGDSSVNWQCRVWCQPQAYWDVRERVTFAVKEAMDKGGIAIPYPQVDVNMVGKVFAKTAA